MFASLRRMQRLITSDLFLHLSLHRLVIRSFSILLHLSPQRRSRTPKTQTNKQTKTCFFCLFSSLFFFKKTKKKKIFFLKKDFVKVVTASANGTSGICVDNAALFQVAVNGNFSTPIPISGTSFVTGVRYWFKGNTADCLASNSLRGSVLVRFDQIDKEKILI